MTYKSPPGPTAVGTWGGVDESSERKRKPSSSHRTKGTEGARRGLVESFRGTQRSPPGPTAGTGWEPGGIRCPIVTQRWRWPGPGPGAGAGAVVGARQGAARGEGVGGNMGHGGGGDGGYGGGGDGAELARAGVVAAAAMAGCQGRWRRQK